MKGNYLWKVDWKMMPGALLREAAVRFCMLLALSALLSAILLSGGMDRYLSGRWTITAVLKLPVAAAEGEGIARKAADLPGVHSASYKDPEKTWAEFLGAYPELESLKEGGGNPLPGYVEVRMRPDRFSEGDIRYVEAPLKALSEVEKVLSGGDMLPRLLQLCWWVKVLMWGGFLMLSAVFVSFFYLQEKSRAMLLYADFRFLGERGVPARRMALSRAAGTALAACVLSTASSAATFPVFRLLTGRVPLFSSVIGPAGEMLTPAFLLPMALFVLAASILSGGASFLGWRAAQPRLK